MNEEDKLNQNEIKSSSTQIGQIQNSKEPEVTSPTGDQLNQKPEETIFAGPTETEIGTSEVSQESTESEPTESEPTESGTTESKTNPNLNQNQEAEVILDKRLVEGKEPYYLVKWKNKQE